MFFFQKIHYYGLTRAFTFLKQILTLVIIDFCIQWSWGTQMLLKWELNVLEISLIGKALDFGSN